MDIQITNFLGYVVVDKTWVFNAVKLVDRLEFSTANFNLQKIGTNLKTFNTFIEEKTRRIILMNEKKFIKSTYAEYITKRYNNTTYLSSIC